MLATTAFAYLILIFNLFSPNTPKDSISFNAPLKIPIRLSSNFGELRSDHFHSGIDIKTDGRIGKEVIAAADGYVYRIGALPGGFGNTLYIRHPSGYSTVYAHLDRFIPEIQDYVTDQQYENESFQINIYPENNLFVFKQGDLIGYSGNSGGSTGPHLHYEIRDTETEHPVNPLSFEFGIEDTRKPIFDKLVIYPLENESRINSRDVVKTLNIEGNNGEYYIHPNNEIILHGKIGFGIRAYDLLNGSSNKCGIYSMSLIVDSNIVYKYLLDEYAYDETRYVNSHVDYETLRSNGTYVQQLFVAPNDNLSIYENIVDSGKIDFSDDNDHNIEIILKDSHNNFSKLSFVVESDPAIPEKIDNKDQDKPQAVFSYNQVNIFRADNFYISVPEGTLYDNLDFRYSISPSMRYMLSNIHSVHHGNTPLHKSFILKIRATETIQGKEDKMVIVNLTENKTKRVLQTELTPDGYFTAEPSVFGDYYIDIDTVPPRISPQGNINGVDFSDRNEIRIRITDDLSGIGSYEGLIDNRWALFEYDQKNDLLVYKFSKARIDKSTEHQLKLIVTDNVDNTTQYDAAFIW